MPIEVHCPNPACARVHAVKNRYAGMRGKCPACGSWMYVPDTGALPSMAAPRPQGLHEAAASWKAEPRQAAPPEGRSVRLEDAVAPPAAPAPAGEPAVAAEEGPARPGRKFSWAGALLLVLAMAALGLVWAAPYLPKPEARGSAGPEGEAAALALKGLEDHQFHGHLQALAPCVAGGALLCLLAALVARRFDFPSLLLLYLTTAGAALVLLLALKSYSGEAEILSRAEELAERRRAADGQGQFTLDRGLQLPALVGGAAGACLLLLLTAAAVHRRWWSKLLGVVLLGGLIALAPAWVYQHEWGLAEHIPKAVKDAMPF